MWTLTAVRSDLVIPDLALPRSRWALWIAGESEPLIRPLRIKWEWRIDTNDLAASDVEMELFDRPVRIGDIMAASSESNSD